MDHIQQSIEISWCLDFGYLGLGLGYCFFLTLFNKYLLSVKNDLIMKLVNTWASGSLACTGSFQSLRRGSVNAFTWPHVFAEFAMIRYLYYNQLWLLSLFTQTFPCISWERRAAGIFRGLADWGCTEFEFHGCRCVFHSFYFRVPSDCCYPGVGRVAINMHTACYVIPPLGFGVNVQGCVNVSYSAWCCKHVDRRGEIARAGFGEFFQSLGM